MGGGDISLRPARLGFNARVFQRLGADVFMGHFLGFAQIRLDPTQQFDRIGENYGWTLATSFQFAGETA